MKLIPLSQKNNCKNKKLNLFAQVDDEDFDRVNEFTWCVTECKNGQYLYATNRIKGLLHRFILGITDRKILVDHEDHNGLNCQKYNIRSATFSQNAANRKTHGSSKYLGVSLHKKINKKKDGTIGIVYRWQASIKINQKPIYLGQYKKEEDAARTYDKAAKIHHGEFANLNFK